MGSRVHPSHDGGYGRDFESEIMSFQAGAMPHQQSVDVDYMAQMESIVGDSINRHRFQFYNGDVELAFITAQCEQRQSEEFRFLDKLEMHGAYAILMFWTVVSTTSSSGQAALVFAYIATCSVFVVWWFLAKFVERFFRLDSSIVTAYMTAVISLGFPMIQINPELAGDAAGNGMTDRVVAETAAIVVLQHLFITAVSPTSTLVFVRMSLATAIVFSVEAFSIIGLLGVQHLTSALATTVLVVVMVLLMMRFKLSRDMLARRSWIMAAPNAEFRKQLLDEAVLKRSPHSNYDKVSSNGRAEVEACFERIQNNTTMKRLRIDPNDLEVQGFVGRGAMGEVFEARYLEAPVALKRLPVALLTKETCEGFIAEVKLLKGLRHPNVVQLMGVTWSDKTEMVGMVLELMLRGSLRSVLQDQSLQMNWEDPKCKLAIDLAKGMAFLHGQDIVHRDLKTENVLVSSTFTSKVSDFGTSRILRGMANTPVGTPFWRAPEMIRGEQYDAKADVYSFAMVLLEIATGQNPFEEMTPLDALEFPHKVAHEQFRLDIPSDVPRPIRVLIEQCWHPSPEKRPPFLLVRRRLSKFLNELSSDDSKELDQLAKVMMDQIVMSGEYRRQTFKDGEVIINWGDHGAECFIVTSGQVEIFTPNKDHADFSEDNVHTDWKLVDTVGVGSYFGEMGMYAGTERSATCRAKGSVGCIVFDRELFARLDEDIHAMVAAKIMRCIKADRPEESDAADKRRKLQKELQSRILTRMDTIHAAGSFLVPPKDDAGARSPEAPSSP